MPPTGVIGAGAWGTALALAASRTGAEVVLWGRDPAAMAAIQRERTNAQRLPGIGLPPAIEAVSELSALGTADPLLLAVPAQTIGEVSAWLPSGKDVVICAKGLQRGTGSRLSEVIASARPDIRVAVLSGPSFAMELARGLPTAVTLAAPELAAAQRLAASLTSSGFRLYPTDDVVGVEIGGALKNVIAIAAGVVMGRELGENARAAVITRGLAELARLGQALGARPVTLMGLSGLGDLTLSATSLTSRNARFGYDFGRGGSAAELMGAGHPLSEGAWTAEAACQLAASIGVELPIAAVVRDVIANRTTIEDGITALLSRPPASSE